MILPITARHEYVRIRDDALALLGFSGLPCLPMIHCAQGEESHPTLGGEWCTVFQLDTATYVFRDSVWRVFPPLPLPKNTAWGAELVEKKVYISDYLGDSSGLTKDLYKERVARVASLHVPTTLHSTTKKPWAQSL